ncbi:MAG: hypothetical protein FJ087_04415 [Deltaproteobacteria bacterium]|nr:hypothetical protein [Deltaproteobacteria bacterium]
MNTRRRRIAAIVGTLLVAGLIVACASLVRRDDRIRFSHKLHVKDQELSCDSCHDEVMKSERLSGPMWPKEAKCLECHEKEEGKCGLCHVDPGRPRTWKHVRTPGVSFSHATHVEVTEGRCEPCHAGVAQREAPSEADRPIPHDACMSCHRAEFRKIECRKCHEDMVENPSRPTQFFSHDGDFMLRHGTLANGDEQVCAHCHRQSFCADCHSRTEVLKPSLKHSERPDAPLIHRGDFLARHAIEARLDPSSCAKCHARQECTTCHEARRVTPGSGGRFTHGVAAREWASDDPSDPNLHSRDARVNAAGCAACHDRGPATNCIRCHKVGGAGGNPHPAGWSSWQKDGPMCRWCHVNGAGL